MSLKPDPASLDFFVCIRDTSPTTICGMEFRGPYRFQAALAHLKHRHGVLLEPLLDLCTNCEQVFSTPLQGCIHFLTHALNIIQSSRHMASSTNYEEYSVDHDLALRKLLDPLNTMILSLTDAEDYIFTDHPPPQTPAVPEEPEEPEELEEPEEPEEPEELEEQD